MSDNGSIFKSEELKKLLSDHRIEWKFNVALGGGFFERLVRSTKRCVKKTLGTARVNYEELLSVVVEIEGILNSRPLTYVGDELRSPFTPSRDFLPATRDVCLLMSNIFLTHSPP